MKEIGNMLVLRRKIGEEIRIGDGVVIKVLAINGRSVRIGIQAPEAMPIWRAEWMSTTPGPKGLERVGQRVVSCDIP
jgi:carbon storage regulator